MKRLKVNHSLSTSTCVFPASLHGATQKNRRNPTRAEKHGKVV
jgi:hypothetical protein